LVQAIIALLGSLEDNDWSSVRIEPDDTLEKVDIFWQKQGGSLAVQVKSSQNQIGKAAAERWALELRRTANADRYELILVGPCSHAVVGMKGFRGVEIPCPKNLDIHGLIAEASHSLDRFLEQEQLPRYPPDQREALVHALTARLSSLASLGHAMSRADLIALITSWTGSSHGLVASPWELVTFDHQRDITSAVAGQQLGPADVDACPQLPVCDDIVTELSRSHFYELVGIAGCGKSITAWHAAKKLAASGLTVWRPRATAEAEELLSSIPRAGVVLVIDNAQVLGPSFANRISEASGPDTKVLLVSTVQDALQANSICVSPGPCVDRLASWLLPKRDAFLPVIRQYDTSVGNRYGDTSFEDRVQQARSARTPWEFFWILRGGWRTARREFQSLKQFPHAADILFFIAAGQIASCDAGVSHEWLLKQSERAGITGRQMEAALETLRLRHLVPQEDPLRTKHLSYARQFVQESFTLGNRDSWSHLGDFIANSMCWDGWSLKGVCWLRDAAFNTDFYRWGKRETFAVLVEPLMRRCSEERVDIDWAAGCLAGVLLDPEIPTEEILRHRDLISGWATSRCGLVSYFCGNIVNEVINRSDYGTGDPARTFIDAFNGARLADLANTVTLRDLDAFGWLLNRLGFYGPYWAAEFMQRLNWARIQGIILAASADHARGVDSFVSGLSHLAEPPGSTRRLPFVEDVVPFITKALNTRPGVAVDDMGEVFGTLLGFRPRFLRGGRSPEPQQIRVAHLIVAGLEPESFARALEHAVSRDLEQLARALAVVHEIEPDFVRRVAACLVEDQFFVATHDDWVMQSTELQHLLMFFCIEKDFCPAATWVQKNRHLIAGPLKTFLACVAPEVAVEMHQAGRGVELTGHPARWADRGFAITQLTRVNRRVATEIVVAHLEALCNEVHVLTLDSPKDLVRFFRAVHNLSSELFVRLIEGIDLDSSTASETISSLLSTQPRERRHYRALARCGSRIPGRVAALSMELLRRLEAGQSP
jgi:hypothetical protein